MNWREPLRLEKLGHRDDQKLCDRCCFSDWFPFGNTENPLSPCDGWQVGRLVHKGDYPWPAVGDTSGLTGIVDS